MLIEGEAKRGRCSVKYRLEKGDDYSRRGLKRAMLSEEEAKIRRCSVKKRLKEGVAQLRRCSKSAKLSEEEAKRGDTHKRRG